MYYEPLYSTTHYQIYFIVTIDEIGALDGSIVTFGPTDVAGQSTPYKDNLKGSSIQNFLYP